MLFPVHANIIKLPLKAASSVVASAVLSTISTTPTSAAASSASPPSVPNGNGNPYKLLLPGAGSASILNSCDYPVYVLSAGNPSCGSTGECQLLAAKFTYTEKLRICKEGGISLKVAKAKDMLKPMQFEYTVSASQGTVAYDISYLDCMNNANGQKDLSDCAGQEGGIQAAGGISNDPSCPDYHCPAGEWCDKQAYVVAEFDYKPGAPVGVCAVDKGIAFELCAGDR